jgi:ubiquinone/menaquinone biosynthesis C-methylase UbiE
MPESMRNANPATANLEATSLETGNLDSTNLDSRNLDTWNSPDVASYYSLLNYLTPCERLLFEEYLSPGIAILDLGVGGGRTTPYLSSIAGRYVGADYAAEMVAACRRKFPNLEFDTVDAADLSRFATSSFDAIVMAFNTMDNVVPDESRHRALREIHRVLKPEGILIFSSHNMRSIWVRPSWNQQRLISLASQLVGSDSILYRPLLWSLTGLRATIATVRSLAGSITRVIRRMPTRAFWRGEGYMVDGAHGGARIHLSTPAKTEEELGGFGFRLLRVLGDDYPQVSRRYVTDWYYYVFSRLDHNGRKQVCA